MARLDIVWQMLEVMPGDGAYVADCDTDALALPTDEQPGVFQLLRFAIAGLALLAMPVNAHELFSEWNLNDDALQCTPTWTRAPLKAAALK